MRKNPFKEIYKNKEKKRNISKSLFMQTTNIISSFLLTQISLSAFELIRPSVAFADSYTAGLGASKRSMRPHLPRLSSPPKNKNHTQQRRKAPTTS